MADQRPRSRRFRAEWPKRRAVDVRGAAPALAGLTLAIRAGGGLYWLLPAAVASLLVRVTSAWLFLVRITGQRCR